MTEESIKVSQVTNKDTDRDHIFCVVYNPSLYCCMQRPVWMWYGLVCMWMWLCSPRICAGGGCVLSFIIRFIVSSESIKIIHLSELASECVHSNIAQLQSTPSPPSASPDSLCSVPLFRCLVIKVQILRGEREASGCLLALSNPSVCDQNIREPGEIKTELSAA